MKDKALAHGAVEHSVCESLESNRYDHSALCSLRLSNWEVHMPLDFDLNDEQQMLRKMVRNFAEKEIAPIAQELDDKEEFSYTLTKRMGDLGLFGPFVPEEYGGSNVGYVSYIIAVEEIARIDGSQAATLAAGNSLGNFTHLLLWK